MWWAGTNFDKTRHSIGNLNRDGLTTRADKTSGVCSDCSSAVSMRHRQGANYLWVDGHVKWFKRGGYDRAGDKVGANATVNGVNYYYWWRKGVTGK